MTSPDAPGLSMTSDETEWMPPPVRQVLAMGWAVPDMVIPGRL